MYAERKKLTDFNDNDKLTILYVPMCIVYIYIGIRRCIIYDILFYTIKCRITYLNNLLFYFLFENKIIINYNNIIACTN